MKKYIEETCDEIKDLLIEKNESYGNSISEPIGVFYNGLPDVAIDVRIDDKLSRIAEGKEYPGDDTVLDLIGYLILKRALAKKNQKRSENTRDDYI